MLKNRRGGGEGREKEEDDGGIKETKYDREFEYKKKKSFLLDIVIDFASMTA